MTRKHFSKLIHVGKYAAEVDVDLIYTDDEWSPYLSLNDARKLDDVREALRNRDIKTASRFARVFKLAPIAA
ncbi:MAG TPA: hypothetical protein G4N96_02740 [Chloroflexi bacterium]|nr:hypothetical protein [Chloroflexota bacterium]